MRWWRTESARWRRRLALAAALLLLTFPLFDISGLGARRGGRDAESRTPIAADRTQRPPLHAGPGAGTKASTNGDHPAAVGTVPAAPASAVAVAPKEGIRFVPEHAAPVVQDAASTRSVPAAAASAHTPAPAKPLSAAQSTTADRARSAAAEVLIETDGLQPAAMAVSINGQNVSQGTVLMRDSQGRWYGDIQDLRDWRLRLPPQASWRRVDGHRYAPLNAVPGARVQVVEASAALSLEVPAYAFIGSRVALGRAAAPPPVRSGFGGFLNYDVLGQYTDGGGKAVSGLVEGGVFASPGVFTTSALFTESDTERSAPVRLDSTFTRDMPGRLASLRLGDAISDGGSFGRSVRFGGIQYATDFALQPNLITFPLPSLNGAASLPSTVDIYVNGSRVGERRVQPGPFTIPYIPVITGSGEVQLVVTDALGRQQVLTRSFYASARLLKPGLDAFSLEAGAEREDYGVDSAHYGPGFVAATYQRGFSDDFTGELHAEALASQQTLGFSGAWQLPLNAVLTASLAGSQHRRSFGALAELGVQHQGRHFNFGFNTTYTSAEYTELGADGALPLPRWQTVANVGTTVAGIGSLGAAFIDRDDRVFGRTSLVSASYSRDVFHLGYLSVTGTKAVAGSSGDSVFVNLTVPLGARTSASLGVQSQSPGQELPRQTLATTTVSQSPPLGPGWGYRASAAIGQGGYGEAEADLNTTFGAYRFDVNHFAGVTGYRAEASGSVATLGGAWFAARQIPEAFALVQVPGFAGVRVYEDNQLVGRTDANGDLLLSQLRPYQRNPITISAEDLPLSAGVDRLSLDAVPYRHAGVVVRFPVHRQRAATLRLLDQHGQPVPPNAAVSVNGRAQTVVGLHGEVYLENLADHNHLVVRWDGQVCTLDIAAPAPGADPLPDLGVRTCRLQTQAVAPGEPSAGAGLARTAP